MRHLLTQKKTIPGIQHGSELTNEIVNSLSDLFLFKGQFLSRVIRCYWVEHTRHCVCRYSCQNRKVRKWKTEMRRNLEKRAFILKNQISGDFTSLWRLLNVQFCHQPVSILPDSALSIRGHLWQNSRQYRTQSVIVRTFLFFCVLF